MTCATRKLQKTDPGITSYSEFNNESPGSHEGGEFFLAILWDLRGDAEIGDSQADFLVYDALSGVSSNPDFLEFRDAMMTADNAAYGGNHNNLIQNTFATWGIGQPASTSPSAPTNLEITNKGTGMGSPSLDWDDNTDPDLDHYEVWRRRMDQSYNFSLLASPSSSSYTDFSVDMSQSEEEFRYKVLAVNSADMESDYSNMVSVMGSTFMKVDSTATGPISVRPETYELEPNYPNPFNPATTIKYQLPEQAEVRLDVYNILGRNVATLVNETQTAGFYTTSFDGQSLASGLYIARLQAEGESGQRVVEELQMQLVK